MKSQAGGGNINSHSGGPSRSEHSAANAGGGGAGGAGGAGGGQEFDSWRHQTAAAAATHQQPTAAAAAAAGFNPMSSLAGTDPYGFYQQSAFHHYPGFGVGGVGEGKVIG